MLPTTNLAFNSNKVEKIRTTSTNSTIIQQQQQQKDIISHKRMPILATLLLYSVSMRRRRCHRHQHHHDDDDNVQNHQKLCEHEEEWLVPTFNGKILIPGMVRRYGWYDQAHRNGVKTHHRYIDYSLPIRTTTQIIPTATTKQLLLAL